MIPRDADDEIAPEPEANGRSARQKRYGVAPPFAPGIETPSDIAKAALRLGRAKLKQKRSSMDGVDRYSTKAAEVPPAVAVQLGAIPKPIGRKGGQTHE